MKAIRIHRHGGPEVIQIDEIPVPQPNEDELLIKIKAASINHLDLWVRAGIPGLSLPLILGSDAAGCVESLGSRKSKSGKFDVGDEVFLVPFRSKESDTSTEELSNSYQILGEHVTGVQAEYVIAPVDFVMQKPANISLPEVAAFPLAYMTSYHMLVKKVHIKSDHKILIWGASSGVGSAAIQIAKQFGAFVITTAGTEKKMQFAHQMGADHVINYNKENVSERVREITNTQGVDIVFEHTGEQSWLHSLRSLKKGGKIVTCGSTTGYKVSLDLRHIYIKQQQIIGSTMGNRQDLIELVRLIEHGKIKPVIGNSLPYTDIREAHQIMEQNQQMGKIVINF